MVLGLSGPARDRMDVQAMTVWLTAFGDAWERGDADAAAALFAPGATFQPSHSGISSGAEAGSRPTGSK
jgi:hypothetical protein